MKCIRPELSQEDSLVSIAYQYGINESRQQERVATPHLLETSIVVMFSIRHASIMLE